MSMTRDKLNEEQNLLSNPIDQIATKVTQQSSASNSSSLYNQSSTEMTISQSSLSSSAAISSILSIEEKNAENQGDYALYLLADNEPASLYYVKDRIKNGNAVLLYPDPTDKSSIIAHRYKACFIQNGKLRINSTTEKLVEVSIGKRSLSAHGALPCEVTKTLFNAANLVKAAIAKAGIVITPPLLQLPSEVMQEGIVPKLDNKSLSHFANTSNYTYELFQPELHHRRVKKLFAHILLGEMAEVKKMLEANPHLALVKWAALTEEEKVMTNMGKQRIYIEGKTAYQLALGEEDTEMAALLKAYIVKVADEKEADAQFLVQFPEGWEEEEIKRWAKATKLLDDLAQAIRSATYHTADPNIDDDHIELDANIVEADIISSGRPEYKLTLREGSNVAQLLHQYKKSLEDIQRAAVNTGRHFNPNLLQKGFETYEVHFEDYFGNGWTEPRALLYWRGGIGSSEGLMPANYFQACQAGSFYVTAENIREGIPQGRSLEFQLYDAVSHRFVVVPFTQVSARIGVDVALYSGRAELGRGPRVRRGDLEEVAELILSKSNKFGELMPRELVSRKSPGCSIQ